ncbi:MAG TPA: thioesterase family protein [Streptosporangiaceae bacterium]|jgi:acyl-CoA thioester hydrolase|nr:thioesterase family protein [Streptosporangiaceae bacterium]
MTEPAASPPLHVDRFRVSMADTDAAQIIYFGAPVRWAERLATGYLADIGLPTSAMLASGHGMPAVDLHVTYRRPLRLDDQVQGELRVLRRSSRSITWQSDFFRKGESQLAVQVHLTQVSVKTADGEPSAVPLPAELITQLDQPAGQPGEPA